MNKFTLCSTTSAEALRAAMRNQQVTTLEVVIETSACVKLVTDRLDTGKYVRDLRMRVCDYEHVVPVLTACMPMLGEARALHVTLTDSVVMRILPKLVLHRIAVASREGEESLSEQDKQEITAFTNAWHMPFATLMALGALLEQLPSVHKLRIGTAIGFTRWWWTSSHDPTINNAYNTHMVETMRMTNGLGHVRCLTLVEGALTVGQLRCLSAFTPSLQEVRLRKVRFAPEPLALLWMQNMDAADARGAPRLATLRITGSDEKIEVSCEEVMMLAASFPNLRVLDAPRRKDEAGMSPAWMAPATAALWSTMVRDR